MWLSTGKLMEMNTLAVTVHIKLYTVVVGASLLPCPLIIFEWERRALNLLNPQMLSVFSPFLDFCSYYLCGIHDGRVLYVSFNFQFIFSLFLALKQIFLLDHMTDSKRIVSTFTRATTTNFDSVVTLG